MIIERITENLKDIPSLEEYHLERVYLEPEQLLKRVLRVKTDHGTELGIDLIEGERLHDGDILLRDKSRVIAIFVNSSQVIKITPSNIHDMGYIAHQLGNRHLPAQFDEDSMYVEYDYLVERLLKQLNIPYTILDKKLSEPFRHIKIEGGHGEANHDVRKDINKDADKLDQEHSHTHSHGEYDHSHTHSESDKDHIHSHKEHSHEHNHDNYSHQHSHSEIGKEHSHEHGHNGVKHTHNHSENDDNHSHNHK